MSTREWVIHGLAEIIEELDERFGCDTAPYSAEASTELGFPDLAYESLLYVGIPAPAALDMVLEAADAVGADRGLCFDLILHASEPWTWPRA